MRYLFHSLGFSVRYSGGNRKRHRCRRHEDRCTALQLRPLCIQVRARPYPDGEGDVTLVRLLELLSIPLLGDELSTFHVALHKVVLTHDFGFKLSTVTDGVAAMAASGRGVSTHRNPPLGEQRPGPDFVPQLERAAIWDLCVRSVILTRQHIKPACKCPASPTGNAPLADTCQLLQPL